MEKKKLAGDEGKEAATFMKNIGQYFNDGFAATDYATAQVDVPGWKIRNVLHW